MSSVSKSYENVLSLSITCNFPLKRIKVKVKSLSHVRLFATPWTVAYQAPQSMEFSRQEYWSGLPCPLPGDLLDLGIKPVSLMSNLHCQEGSLPLVTPGKPLI